MGDSFRRKNITQKKRTTPKSVKNKTLHKRGGGGERLKILLLGFLILVGQTEANGGPLKVTREVDMKDHLFGNGQTLETNVIKLHKLAKEAGLTETTGFFNAIKTYDYVSPPGPLTQIQAAAALELAEELRKEIPNKTIKDL